MKLLIIGATGPTGQHLVKEALQREHDVTALVRNPDKLQVTNDKLKVTQSSIVTKVTTLKLGISHRDVKK